MPLLREIFAGGGVIPVLNLRHTLKFLTCPMRFNESLIHTCIPENFTDTKYNPCATLSPFKSPFEGKFDIYNWKQLVRRQPVLPRPGFDSLWA